MGPEAAVLRVSLLGGRLAAPAEETRKPTCVPAVTFDCYLKSILLHWLGQLRPAAIYVTEGPLGGHREGDGLGLHRTDRSLLT